MTEPHVSTSDPLSTPETRARGAWYGVSGIPDVRIQGDHAVVGAGSCNGAAASYRPVIQAELQENGGVSPVGIRGDFTINGNIATLEATYVLLDPVVLTDLQATFFLYEDRVYWCCGYGGASIWDETVRKIEMQNITLTNVGDEVTVTRQITIDPTWNPAELHAVAILQQTSGNKPIIQANRLPNELDFSVSFQTLLGSAPEGNETVYFDASIQNIGVDADVITLSVAQDFGWPTDFQVEGDPNWYTSHDVPLGLDETKGVTVRVQTDGDVRIGQGTFTATSANTGRAQDVTLRIFNGSYALLLVDDDANSGYELPFEEALDNLGVLYDNWDVYYEHGGSAPELGTMAGYDVLIWSTGYRTSDLITPTDAANLMAYLDNGGALYVNSMDLLTSYQGAPEFLSDYLGVDTWSNNTKADVQNGVDGDPVTDGLSIGLDFPTSTANRVDTVNPSAAGTVIFYNEFGHPNATRVDGGTFRTVFVTALQDAIYDFNAANSQLVIERILNWLVNQDPTSVEDPGVVRAARLLWANPNPFRPTTELGFHLSRGAAAAPVRLALVDPAGRVVRTLIDGRLEPGVHRVVWDGQDGQGREAPSGIYFGRLETAEGETTTKLVRVR